MTTKNRALAVIKLLEELYPDARCSLEYTKPYELLIAVRLSAQCTDARVNVVCEKLFLRYPTLESFATADYAQLEELVRPCGLGKTKAADIIAIANSLISDFSGLVPNSMEKLLSLSGVGRKTANLILGDIYGKPSIVTDTHCIRISGRLGLTDGSKAPLSVENQLRKILPEDKSGDFCHRLVMFGREWCTARSPKCVDFPLDCPLSKMCLKRL